MVMTNHTAALNNANAARKSKKGGPRPGGGRPLGARDTIPRKGTVPEDDRFAALQAELGKAYRQRDDLQRQVDDLRHQLNYGKSFPGDSKALLTATYKAEYYPTQEQIYAAKTLLEKEYPSNLPGEIEYDSSGKVVVYLPHNHRDSLAMYAGDDENRAWIYQQLDKLGRKQHREFDEKLHAWIAEGLLTEAAALKVRSLWEEPNDLPWEPCTQKSPTLALEHGHRTDTAPENVSNTPVSNTRAARTR
jgi:hypothetical protein